jgi:Tfp pilus assembly pilus retraction ATPase PilT
VDAPRRRPALPRLGGAAVARRLSKTRILEISPESGQESIGPGEGTEWIAEFENVGRVRCTTFTDHRGQGVLLRLIVTKAATAEQLGLAQEVQALATESQGPGARHGPARRRQVDAALGAR